MSTKHNKRQLRTCRLIFREEIHLAVWKYTSRYPCPLYWMASVHRHSLSIRELVCTIHTFCFKVIAQFVFPDSNFRCNSYDTACKVTARNNWLISCDVVMFYDPNVTTFCCKNQVINYGTDFLPCPRCNSRQEIVYMDRRTNNYIWRQTAATWICIRLSWFGSKHCLRSHLLKFNCMLLF